jgi:hypothetical protein
MQHFWSFWSLVWPLPVAKIAYSAVLTLIIVLLARELHATWADNGLYVGKFEYFADGKADAQQGQAFPAHVLGQHLLLRTALVAEARRREAQMSRTAPAGAEVYRGLPSSLPEVTRWQSALADVEMKIQGFDFGKLLTQVRSWISPPNEINGFVEKSGNYVRATINWPAQGVRVADKELPAYDSGQLPSEATAALAIAASIIWTQAAAADREFRKIPRDAFVTWTIAWWDYRKLRDRERLGSPWQPDDIKVLAQARILADRLVEHATTYPEIWRLRADIIELTPKANRGDVDDAIAAEDRRKYDAALGIEPAKAAASTLGLGGVLQQAQLRYLEKALGPRTILSARQVWGRLESSGTKGADFAVTATAVVEDRDRKRKLILPDYVVYDLADGEVMALRLTPTGDVVARVRRSDLVTRKGGEDRIGSGVVLAELAPGARNFNVVATGGIGKLLADPGPPPKSGDQLTIYTNRPPASTTVKSTNGAFVVTDQRVTGPGDGGAPVVDADGRLVAMAYAAGPNESRFLALDWLFAERDLKLWSDKLDLKELLAPKTE